MPADFDSDEDWYNRRRRIDAAEQMEEQRMQMPPPIHDPIQLAQSQAFAMAGLSSQPSMDLRTPDYVECDAEHLYR